MYFFVDQGSETNTWGRSSLPHKIKVWWTADDVCFSILPIDCEINEVGGLREAENSLSSGEFEVTEFKFEIKYPREMVLNSSSNFQLIILKFL